MVHVGEVLLGVFPALQVFLEEPLHPDVDIHLGFGLGSRV